MSEVVDLVPAHPVDPPATHPAATFGKRAQLAGWRVEYRAARGPLTVRRRPDEPDERGKYALASVVEVADTLGVRAQHPDGRRIAAWWVGRGFGEGWVASPRRNARRLGIRALTAHLTETEEAAPMPEPEKERERTSALFAAAKAAFDAGAEERQASSSARMPHNLFTAGYLAGTDAANERAGNAFEEGYAQGLAAVAGQARVWVKARRRLDALRPRSESYPGDVVLGKGDRWWIVTEYHALPARQWHVIAYSGEERLDVRSDRKRYVDVVEEIALADALAALKEGDLPGTPIEDESEAA